MFKLIALTIVLGLVAADHIDKDAEVRSFSNVVNEDGTYSYQFDTTNGIAIQEAGTGGVVATGSASHTSPEGQQIQLTYTADENGFQPAGAHLPVPPEIPEHVLRALEWNRQHPEEEQEPAQQPGQRRF